MKIFTYYMIRLEKYYNNKILTSVLIALLIFMAGIGIWWQDYNKIMATVQGPEMQEIIYNDETYVGWSGDDECPYNGTMKDEHIGKGAWRDGTVALDIYTLKGDEEINYLYGRSSYEGQMYVREDILE